MNAGRNFVKCLECGEIIHLPDDTEDNQPQAASGTTGCSDAGGGEPSKPGRSADWQAKTIEEIVAWAKKRMAFYEIQPGWEFQPGCRSAHGELDELLGELDAAEERRRSEERT